MTTFSNTGKNFWLMWIFGLLAIFSIQLCTIDVLPSIQKDEIQIADYGRLTLHPLSDWSVNWIVVRGSPILLWSYLGPLLSEFSYHFFGSSGLGPRIVALLGGMVSASMALGWLIARKVQPLISLCLSFAFLLDPLFILSQRMGRVDSWVIAFCLATCWVLRSTDIDKVNSPSLRIMASGSLSAAAALVWPSAIFLYPLIIIEFLHAVKFSTSDRSTWQRMSLFGFYFIVGGLIAITISLAPISKNLLIIFSDASSILSKNIEPRQSFSGRISSIFNYHLWVKLIKAFVKTLSLFLPLLALVGALYRREKNLIISTFLVVVLIFTTLVYELRLLYLLPYFLALASGIFQPRSSESPKYPFHRVAMFTLAIVVFWAFLISIVVRSVFGFDAKSFRQRSKILNVAETSIGKGSYKVFLAFTYEFYYAGRSLGWKLYTPYGQQDYDEQSNWIDRGYNPPDKFVTLFSKMDYAIFNKGAITNDVSKELAVSGLEYSETILLNNNNGPHFREEYQSKWQQLIMFYIEGSEKYGPYLIFKRHPKTLAATK